jgi:hypothetical protein
MVHLKILNMLLLACFTAWSLFSKDSEHRHTLRFVALMNMMALSLGD